MPTFRLKSDGREYTTEQPSEVTRLRLSGKYEEVGVVVPTIAEEQFHPVGQKAGDVVAYMAEHPEEVERIIAEEKADQARPSIVGF